MRKRCRNGLLRRSVERERERERRADGERELVRIREDAAPANASCADRERPEKARLFAREVVLEVSQFRPAVVRPFARLPEGPAAAPVADRPVLVLVEHDALERGLRLVRAERGERDGDGQKEGRHGAEPLES